MFDIEGGLVPTAMLHRGTVADVRIDSEHPRG